MSKNNKRNKMKMLMKVWKKEKSSIQDIDFNVKFYMIRIEMIKIFLLVSNKGDFYCIKYLIQMNNLLSDIMKNTKQVIIPNWNLISLNFVLKVIFPTYLRLAMTKQRNVWT